MIAIVFGSVATALVADAILDPDRRAAVREVIGYLRNRARHHGVLRDHLRRLDSIADMANRNRMPRPYLAALDRDRAELREKIPRFGITVADADRAMQRLAQAFWPRLRWPDE